jgi:hypothetical protein
LITKEGGITIGSERVVHTSLLIDNADHPGEGPRSESPGTPSAQRTGARESGTDPTRTVPVKFSTGALPEGCEPMRFISIVPSTLFL